MGLKENTASVSVSEVFQARSRIKHFVKPSPFIPLHVDIDGINVFLKLENLQSVGSFKLRGAANTLLSMSPEELKDGVHTVSTGNFGHSVAWMAKQLDIPCKVIVPDHVPETKVAGAKRYGAEVVREPWDQWWKYIVGSETPCCEGAMVHPEGHNEILAGTGTIALEILDELPEVDAVVIPYGGGGMTAGIGTVLKTLKPECKVLACEVETAAPLSLALQLDNPTEVDFKPSFVDGIGSNCVLNHVWEVVREVVDGSLVVSLDEIKAAIRHLADRHHVVAEGAGAASTAAVLAGKLPRDVHNVVCVVSGGNIDSNVFAEIIST